MKISSLEVLVANRLERAKIPFKPHYKFHPTRKFEADFFIEPNILIEIEGGLYAARSGHRSMSGVLRDIEKQNEAVALGFRPVRVSRADLDGEDRWLEIVCELLGFFREDPVARAKGEK